eukprot:g11268.t1
MEVPKNLTERQEYRWIINNGTPQMRTKALESLFLKFDINGSGEIDYDEFKKILWWLEFSLSDDGVREVFDELDADHSNCLDMLEFVKFFDVLERYKQMYEQDVKEQQVSLVRSKICQMFFVVIVLATGFFAYSWVAAMSQGKDASKWFTMTMVSCGMLVIGITGRHDRRSKLGVTSTSLQDSMEMLGSTQSPMQSSYRVHKMEQSQLMDSSMYASHGQMNSTNSPQESPTNRQSRQERHALALSDFSRQARPELSDEELIAEYQANEDTEDFAYHQGNYDLAKIQQHQITPSTFNPMATTRYKGNWVQRNNPSLTLQGTSDYVGKSIQNTNRMQTHAQREGLNKQKIENIKLNSTISSGWYAGSCSPYETGGMAPQGTNNRVSPMHGGVLHNKMLTDSDYNVSGKKVQVMAITQG